LLTLISASAEAQVLRGRIVGDASRQALPGATVDVLDSLSRVMQTARTDSAGRFIMSFRNPGLIRIRVRRIGIEPTLTDLLSFESRDTIDVDLLVTEHVTQLDERQITREAPLNQRRLAEARLKGWRVVPPERVARAKQGAQQLEQLLRSVSLSNVMISRDCVRSLVTNGCLTIFVDDQYFGQRGFNMINPADIEFLAVIGPTEALALYGNRAQYGVLMLYTTRFEDRQPRRP
jgi:hypothetical protein